MRSIFIIQLILYISCSSNSIQEVEKKDAGAKRNISTLVELDINDISDSEFEKRKIIQKGNVDKEIDELNDFDQIISESVGEMSLSDISELGHVSEPITQAVIFCHQKKIENGLKILNSIFSSHSKTPRFWNAKGVCHLQENDLKKAKYFFDFANSEKLYPPSLNNLAVLYYRAGDHQKAYMLLESSLKSSRLNTLKYNFAIINYNKGLYNIAIRHLEEILNSNKNMDNVISLLAASYLKVNKVKEYKETFELIKNKNTFFSHINYGLYLGVIGRKEEATKFLENIKIANRQEQLLIASHLSYIKEALK